MTRSELLNRIGCLETPSPGKDYCSEHLASGTDEPTHEAIFGEPLNVDDATGCSKSFLPKFTHTAGLIIDARFVCLLACLLVS
jgi:hypothetical protein